MQAELEEGRTPQQRIMEFLRTGILPTPQDSPLVFEALQKGKEDPNNAMYYMVRCAVKIERELAAAKAEIAALRDASPVFRQLPSDEDIYNANAGEAKERNSR
jgi:hypothetical protein